MTRERFKLLSAVHLFLIREGQVLLLRRYNTGYEDGNYSVVAGHLDGEEEVRAAMAREAREEVGIKVAPQALQVVGVMHRRSDDERIDFFLTATTWSGQVANREPQRCDRLAWYDLDGLPQNVIPYVRQALENYRRGVWFDSFGWPSPSTTPPFHIRPLGDEDREWAAQLVATRWGAEEIVTRGAIHHVRRLPGFVAVAEDERVGLLTYHLTGKACQIVSLDSLWPGIGVGSALIQAARGAAQQAGCQRLWLITTNDNLETLGFYQRRGFALVAVHRDALAVARRLKPEIPLVGERGIPLRDEIELEIIL